MTLLVEDPTWFKATALYFEHETAGAVAGVKPDFPRDFPFDLVQGKPAKSFTNPSKSASPWLWRVYGPATNPYVRIGENLHKVNTTIAAGAYLEVDSQSKTAVVVQDNGTRENVYKFRERGAHGSGSYLFEPIKPGTDDITWDNTFDFDLTLYETRSTPPYEKEQPQGETRAPRAVSTQSAPSEVSA